MAAYHNQKNRQSIRLPEYDYSQPGEMLLEEFLNPMGMTQRELQTPSMFHTGASMILSTAGKILQHVREFLFSRYRLCQGELHKCKIRSIQLALIVGGMQHCSLRRIGEFLMR